jgi:hypothetical protein
MILSGDFDKQNSTNRYKHNIHSFKNQQECRGLEEKLVIFVKKTLSILQFLINNLHVNVHKILYA